MPSPIMNVGILLCALLSFLSLLSSFWFTFNGDTFNTFASLMIGLVFFGIVYKFGL